MRLYKLTLLRAKRLELRSGDAREFRAVLIMLVNDHRISARLLEALLTSLKMKKHWRLLQEHSSAWGNFHAGHTNSYTSLALFVRNR